ncbi:hypothetical protein KKE03_00050 [Patescibacteria group bacterium]|nr:hypothetical protein [Patescibacteria group bacterium]
MGWKIKILILFILIFAALTAAAYFWYQKTNKLLIEAQQNIEDARKYKLIKKAQDAEKTRCQEFINQKEGDFESFEYCKRFIDWSNQNN